MAEPSEHAERMVALMAAGNLPAHEIAAQLHLSTRRVNQLLASPLMKAMVAGYAKEILSQGLQQTVDRITQDAPTNVQFIVDVRDGNFDGHDPDDMRIRMKAGEMLLDRQAPKRTENLSDHTYRFVLESPQRDLADRACNEVGEAIEVEALPAPALDTGPLERFEPTPLDELMQKYDVEAEM